MTIKREKIIALYELGQKQKQISKDLGIPQTTVSYAIRRYIETGNNANRPKSGRKKTVATSYALKRIKQSIKRKPRQSARTLAKRLNINRETVRKVLKNQLKLVPYKRKKVQLLSAVNVKKRLDRCKKFKNRFARHSPGIVFTDEKLFSIQEKLNAQNDRCWVQRGCEVPEQKVTRTQAPAGVMVWAGITQNGKTPLIFIDEGVKVNQQVYKELLEKKVIPWANQHFGNQFWCFQQDSAPAHKAKKVQQFLAENCPDFISCDEWPPSSPDLNPMDYSVWNMLQARVNSKVHRSVDALKRCLKKEWEKMDLKVVTKCYNAWWGKLDSCIKAKGNQFE